MGVRRISDPGLKLNDRCVFGQKKLLYFAHTVSGNVMLPLQTDAKVANNAPLPMIIQSLGLF